MQISKLVDPKSAWGTKSLQTPGAVLLEGLAKGVSRAQRDEPSLLLLGGLWRK